MSRPLSRPLFRSLSPDVSFPALEERILALWDKDDAFRQSVERRPVEKSFAFFDGPPFATGLPHYGHLLAGTIKDIVPRYWTMKGYRVERRFGWDCHGLPIENLIQDELKLHTVKDIRDHGVGAFNEACRAGVLRYTKEWRRTVSRMGRWVDFDNEYKTMDADFMESVWWVFQQCFDKGLIYQGYRIQPYSPALATSLSNFEVNQGYKMRQDPSVVLSFPLESDAGNTDRDEALLVWTTTPWTLPSNLAIAVKEDLEYALVSHDGKKYWIAESRRLAYFKEEDAVIDRVLGKALAGRRYKPLFEYAPYMSEKQYSIFTADFVSDADGTGAVHIAPSFGEEDFQLGKAEGLGLWDPLDAEGKFTALVPDWQGVGAKDADKDILRKLKADGRLFRHETFEHSYPHCWRTDVPLLYRAQKNWFLALDKEITSAEGVTKTLKQWMIDSNQQINWVPGHIRDGRFGKWLEGARDWNLSRNRFWGTCIPVWIAEDGDPSTGSGRDMICVGSRAELEALTGTKVDDLHMHLVDALVIRTSDKKTFDAKGKEYKRTPEVLDCWFESGSMPYAQGHYPFENREALDGNFPADFIAEGLDQTRGWFYTLTVLSAALFQKPAMKNVIVNGIILAEDGQKMSKRLRNYPDPNELIDRAAVKGEELKFSEAGVKNITRAVLLPLWNAVSLFTTYANADASKGQLGWKPGGPVRAIHELPLLDRWILSDLQALLRRVSIEMEAYRLYNVVPALVEFVDDLTNWYIRRSRRRFWKSENDGDKNDAYATLYNVLVEFSKALAPFLPFLSEEIYQILVREPSGATAGTTPRQGQVTKPAHEVAGTANESPSSLQGPAPTSVHHTDYPTFDAAFFDEALNAKMALARQAVVMGRALRAERNIKNRQPLARLLVVARNEAAAEGLRSLEDLIRDELNVKKVEISLDESSFVTYKAKPNFKALGARLGKNMKAVAGQCGQLSHEEIKSVLDGTPLALDEITLTAEDLLILREVSPELAVTATPDLTVALDTAVDEALRLEMLARETISRIQNLRKESGLAVTDRVAVVLEDVSAQLRHAVETHRGYISAEVLADSIRFDGPGSGASESLDVDGETARIFVSKV
jgi:isoleucyl-tRNA synthetase